MGAHQRGACDARGARASFVDAPRRNTRVTRRVASHRAIVHARARTFARAFVPRRRADRRRRRSPNRARVRAASCASIEASFARGRRDATRWRSSTTRVDLRFVRSRAFVDSSALSRVVGRRHPSVDRSTVNDSVGRGAVGRHAPKGHF